MNKTLWQKSDFSGANDAVQSFLAGQDIVLDGQLLRFDIQASKAHVRGLERIGVLSEAESKALVDCLDEIERDFVEGRVSLESPHEDGHSFLESELTARLGDVGGKVHTGRSRNDQVQVAMRLYLRDRLDGLCQLLSATIPVCLELARQGEQVVMPGYTHLQRAMPSSLGHWWAGYAEAFIETFHLAMLTRGWINSSPLGSAAGFGVNLPLDRAGVAEELAFDRLQINPQNVQNSRGRYELQVLNVFAQASLELRRISWDISLFSSQEFAFVQCGQAYCTGSSIMPNKRNPDLVELLRAVHATVAGSIVEVQSLLALPSGYQRDLQEVKPPVLRAITKVIAAFELMPEFLSDLEFDAARMRECIDQDMFATDRAVDMAKAGVPFREAYVNQGADDTQRSPEQSISDRVSPGAPGALLLDQLEDRYAHVLSMLENN